MPEDKNQNTSKLNNSGFALLESLVGMVIFSLVFLALSTAIWSATDTFRTTTYADESVITGQDVVEMLSVIDITDVTSPVGSSTRVIRGDQIIEYDVVDTDPSGNFKTIAIKVYHSENDAIPTPDELKMQSYYRRMIYQ